MTNLMAAEWLKLRKRWMVRIIVLIMLAIIALIFWGVGTSSQRTNLFFPRGWVVAPYLASTLAPFLWPVLAGSWAGSEYGWGTIRMILSRRPGRIQWTLSAIAVLVLAAGLSLVGALIVATIAGSVVAALTGHSEFSTGGLGGAYPLIAVKAFLAAWYILTFYVVLAYAAGTIFRSGAFGIAGGIGITVAQIVLLGIFFNLGGAWRTVSEHFPYAYTNGLPTRLASEGTTSGFASVPADTAGIGEAIIGIAVYIAILLALTLVAVRARDITS